MATAAVHLASAPSIPASSIFQPWGMNAPKMTLPGCAPALELAMGRPYRRLPGRLRTVRRGAEVAAAVLAVLVVGVAAPSAVGRASAQAPAADAGAQIDQVA